MNITRRQFIGTAAFAAVGTNLLGIPSARGGEYRTPLQDLFGGFPIGVQSYSLRNFDLLETVRHIHGLGLHFAEFYGGHLPLDATDERINDTLELLRESDIRLVAHGVNDFTMDHAANRRIFEFANRSKIRNITANPQPDSFDSLDRLCAEFDIRVCIHNHGPGSLYDKIQDVASVVKDRHPNIGACIDTGHFIRSAEDPVKAVSELRGRVFALHVKDEAEQKADSHNVVIGTGHLDLVGLFKALRETQFPADGSISLEYEANPDNPIEDMRQCLEQAKQAIAKLGIGGQHHPPIVTQVSEACTPSPCSNSRPRFRTLRERLRRGCFQRPPK
jgi:sugar phosphate isomerase/epimerase